MYFSIAFKRLIYGQHFFSGFFAACGVIGLGLLWHALFELPVAMAMSSGGLCVSLVDLPSPLRHKRVDFAAATLGGAVVTGLIALTLPIPWALAGTLLAVGFAAAMLTAFGKRAMPLSFSPLLAMVLVFGIGGDGALEPVRHALLFLAGGAAYAGYGLFIGALGRVRTKRQALAESLFELAEFARASAAFYGDGANAAACHGALLDQQAIVTERQQAARDLVFADIRTDEEQRLASALKHAIDAYEFLLSAHTEHTLLREHFAGTDTLALLHDLIDKCAQDLEQIAYAVLRHRPVGGQVRYLAELFALEHAIARSPHARTAGGPAREALEALRATVARLHHTIEQIGRLRAVAHPDAPADAHWLTDEAAAPFVSASDYSLRLLADQLSFDSPVMRHAVRSTLALACGALVAHLLPYGTHSYWILLTIVVIMRSSFSAMRQRHGDRLLGNLIGCLAAAMILYLEPRAWVVVAILFACVVVAHTFVTINYRYTSIAACLLALLQLSFVGHEDFLILERLLDTVIGALIAYAFSFVLPSWESTHIARQIGALLQACSAYGTVVLSRSVDERGDRLARKRLFDAIAALSMSARAMLREPRVAQRGVVPLQRFISAAYLYAAHLAALRVLLQRHHDELDTADVSRHLDTALDTLHDELAAAAAAPSREPPPALTASTIDAGDLTRDWSPPARLRRRLSLLEHTARELLNEARALQAAIA